ncbi:hypothetical protein [Alienimonas californiensis]|uniref:Uncharacterized protein n=1 Tax=Alienimonas californiensis TaxID=2527989 RepID=A0A517PBS1_9PLAN|nr:hypothetical protein [Alienimonas californiensis]QDT16812.1 hypothetical protein CA12_29190 [Alienimonas californiensis]
MASPLPPIDKPVGSDDPIPVAEGVSITPAGQVSVDEGLTETLLDLAETLEERTGRPVDVEHVIAAVVLANRAGKIGSDRRLRTGDDLLLMALAPQIEAVFTRYGGLVAEPGEEDAVESAPDEHADPDEAAERT